MEPQEFTNLLVVGLIAGLAFFPSCAESAQAAESGACYTIQRADLRAQCLAEVRQ